MRNGELRYCCAGHPPPLVVSTDGSTRYLWDGRSGPLGSASFGARRAHALDALAPGDTLVLYTDGLVERRGEDLQDGLARLAEAAVRSSAASTEATRDALLHAMIGTDSPTDDVCLMIGRYQPVVSTFTRAIPAEPEAVATVRRALRSWLSEVGVTSEEQHEALLASGEAVANSVEHAYSDRERGDVEVEGRLLDNGRLELVIRDHGGWREWDTEPNRGRGRVIMEALMDDVTVRSDDGGTTVRLGKVLRRRNSR
jgi:anti-sigma regulatory factor (Ser/Thr protein kinase)